MNHKNSVLLSSKSIPGLLLNSGTAAERVCVISNINNLFKSMRIYREHSLKKKLSNNPFTGNIYYHLKTGYKKTP